MSYRETQIKKLKKTQVFQNAMKNPNEWVLVTGSNDVWDAYSLNYFGLVDIDPTPKGAFKIAVKFVKNTETI